MSIMCCSVLSLFWWLFGGYSSIFGICGLIIMQLSINLIESNGFFIDLFFFTVITTGDKKQSSSKFSVFSRCLDLVNLSFFQQSFLDGTLWV